MGCSSSREAEEEEVIQDCLRAQNEYRAKHGVPPLTLDRGLCKMAKKWSNNLRKMKGDQLKHSDNKRRFRGGAVGENIYWKSYSSSDPRLVKEKRLDGAEAAKSWYDEITDPGYRYSAPGFQKGTGHFTQVVWKETTLVGIGVSKLLKDNEVKFYVVANYYPAGNINSPEYFRENVPRPQRH